jgi:hypothetical protein
MFDELEYLRASESLRRLLAHYAQMGTSDREVWQDRLMQLDGVEPRELTRLHGDLLAFGWIEQNTGITSTSKPGMVSSCYRITTQGQRALKRAGSVAEMDEDVDEAALWLVVPGRIVDNQPIIIQSKNCDLLAN